MSDNFAALWDMDGVIVDTYKIHFISWSVVLQEYGTPFNPISFHQIFGMNNRQAIQFLMGESITPKQINEIEEKKEAAFRQAIQGQVQLLPGVRDWLAGLQKQQVSQALATSAPPENIDMILDETHLRPYFSAIVSASNMVGKPDPAVFLKAAEMIGVKPSNCLVIEDSTAGIQAAKLAGMRCLAVTTTNPPELLTLADRVIENLAQLAAEDFPTFFT